MSYNAPQPMPTGDGIEVSPQAQADLDTLATDRETTWYISRCIQADLQERIDWGTAKYHTPLKTNNGRDALIDEYQEHLDALHYCKQQVMQAPDDAGALYRYQLTLRLAVHCRCALFIRDGEVATTQRST